MTLSDYYKILGLQSGSTVDEIKKAYRRKAREFHPDINPSPEAKDKFIIVTEAYEFLITYREKITTDQEAFKQAMEDWRKYRQNRSRYRARVYAQAPYSRFRDTNFYKTTRIFDGTTIILSMIISILVLIVTIYGYIYRIHHPLPGIENPTVTVLVAFVIFGMFLFVISVIYLKAYFQSSRKN
jgi:uncharacterized membrane protein